METRSPEMQGEEKGPLGRMACGKQIQTSKSAVGAEEDEVAGSDKVVGERKEGAESCIDCVGKKVLNSALEKKGRFMSYVRKPQRASLGGSSTGMGQYPWGVGLVTARFWPMTINKSPTLNPAQTKEINMESKQTKRKGKERK